MNKPTAPICSENYHPYLIQDKELTVYQGFADDDDDGSQPVISHGHSERLGAIEEPARPRSGQYRLAVICGPEMSRNR